MPDDNSCLFTAVGGALRGTAAGADGVTPERLRRIVVDYIKDHPDIYTEVVLEKKPQAYCARMLQPDVWGGAIELGIISEVFDIEICVVDVKGGGVIKYGEGKHDLRCVLVWSNIHYDRIAEIFDEEQVGVDFDVTTWSAFESNNVVENAKKLCQRLKDEFHYFTDTSDFLVKCMQCGVLIQGEQAIVEHSRKTGHTAIEEIIDN
jgi:ubiquitin thioesterase OTU1